MKTIAIIQARMGSTRLPGKVLLPLAGDTVLAHVLRRVRAAKQLTDVWIATTTSTLDEPLVAECRRLRVPVWRGSENDVLDRYHGAAREALAEVVVRITSDCPLFDPELLDAMLERFHHLRKTGTPVDYLSNTLARSYPRGLDAEIFTRAGLETCWREARDPVEREHVTPYFYRHPERFHLVSHVNPVDESRHRWTLDTPEDWALIQSIYAGLNRRDSLFTTRDILAFLADRPALVALNAGIEQKKLGQ